MTELVRCRGPLRGLDDHEPATLERGTGSTTADHRDGNVLTAEAEDRRYRQRHLDQPFWPPPAGRCYVRPSGRLHRL